MEAWKNGKYEKVSLIFRPAFHNSIIPVKAMPWLL